jgi:hypothetical protein
MQVAHHAAAMGEHSQRPAKHQAIKPGQSPGDSMRMLGYKWFHGVSSWLVWVFGRNQYSPWNAGNAVPLFGCGLWLR